MKKFILTEDDKKHILGLYNSKIILSEQSWLSKFFGGTVDDIVRNYGDDAARTLDDVFAKIYSKSSNIISNFWRIYRR